MYTLIIIFHILASIFLILVILLQAGRGGGLSESFGGGTMQNIFGPSSTTVLTKITAICATVFILTSLSLTILTGRRSKSLIDLERSRVADIVAGQKKAPAPTQAATQQAAGAAEGTKEPAKTVTVREVKIDPATGKEIVVKEEKMTPQEAAQRQTQNATTSDK